MPVCLRLIRLRSPCRVAGSCRILLTCDGVLVQELMFSVVEVAPLLASYLLLSVVLRCWLWCGRRELKEADSSVIMPACQVLVADLVSNVQAPPRFGVLNLQIVAFNHLNRLMILITDLGISICSVFFRRKSSI
jgi:hypothetical protein